MKKIVVLISGNGTNLQAIIDAVDGGVLPCVVAAVISNRQDAFGIERARKAGILAITIPWNRETHTRAEYDRLVAERCKLESPDLIVLAGWMHLLGTEFLSAFPVGAVINLHPALPGCYPGAHAIRDAWKDGAAYSGVTVHNVILEMDAGTPIATATVPRFWSDSFQSFEKRMKAAEKPLLLQAILLKLGNISSSRFEAPKLLVQGKVRNVYDLGDGRLMIEASDRCSSFDRHICDIPGKGEVLTAVNAWWMRQTQHIIPNHFISRLEHSPVTIVRKCLVFPVEFVVRGWLTGSTQTSIWHHYQQGERQFDGLELEDGLRKNTKLPHPILTPTTKSDEHDEPITEEQVVARGLMTTEQFQTCRASAIELFTFGAEVALERGFILADTKYEFGIDPESGEVMLVDEMHTPDSSRFWVAEGFEEGGEPQRFDKDLIRCWIKERCDPYIAETLPPVDPIYVAYVAENYRNFESKLCGQ